MKTLAIVIGNNEYHKGATLDNAVNDATAISEIFKRLRFDVELLTDITKDDIPNILDGLIAKIDDYDATIIYFAGHGFELDGENYLASINCQIPPAGVHSAGADSIKISEILKIYSKNPNKVNILIIDACRRTFNRGSTLGFSPIQSPRGTLIAFSTSPNDGASDKGYGEHSIYTGVLLDYLGRERLSVEALFKKVRQSVYTLTNGAQTTWEHTSLISDYYFNDGQLVYSLSIPYDESVVMDQKFSESSDFGEIIKAFKSYNFYAQNDALEKVLKMDLNSLDKNQKFILGRNILQAANGGAWECKKFIENLSNTLIPFNESNGENHLLNGILFEIYFDSNGNFRKDKKNRLFEEIFRLRKKSQFIKSFDFIGTLLAAQNNNIIYIPSATDVIHDVDVVAVEKTIKTFSGEEKMQVISKVSINNIDITKEISSYNFSNGNKDTLLDHLSNYLCIPKDLLKINCTINLEKIYFDRDTVITW
ncbi:hypothetical protein JOE44_004901 [Chryseobacterium sp. PvR013]|uniref:caspase family protein n=1 Tax=Chryseobacterium sp. PvR013 TaxID=2806595 RepID=UPI001AE53C8F|nr:caspase family protein [Chryseobacterium sp. PvR013]MBP1168017.1 hypothetical protein [Chryseobacterium sp. PvR013]